MLRHPFTSLTPSTQKKVFLFLCVFTIIVQGTLIMLGKPLINESAPLGIVSFEFARTLPQAQRMTDLWGQSGQIYAALNLGLDYLFLVLYPTSIALGCVLIASTPVFNHMRFSGAGVLLSWGQFGAGGLDAVENFALIKVLFGSQQPAWPELAWWCALIKFALVLAGLIYVVTGTIGILVTKFFK